MYIGSVDKNRGCPSPKPDSEFLHSERLQLLTIDNRQRHEPENFVFHPSQWGCRNFTGTLGASTLAGVVLLNAYRPIRREHLSGHGRGLRVGEV